MEKYGRVKQAAGENYNMMQNICDLRAGRLGQEYGHMLIIRNA